MQRLPLTFASPPIPQRAAQCSPRQSGHHGEAGDLQRAVKRQESKQHAGPPHRAAAQLRAGTQGETTDADLLG